MYSTSKVQQHLSSGRKTQHPCYIPDSSSSWVGLIPYKTPKQLCSVGSLLRFFWIIVCNFSMIIDTCVVDTCSNLVWWRYNLVLPMCLSGNQNSGGSETCDQSRWSYLFWRFNMTSRCRCLVSCFCLRLGSQHISRLNEFMFWFKDCPPKWKTKKKEYQYQIWMNEYIYIHTHIGICFHCFKHANLDAHVFFEYGQGDPRSTAYVGESCGVGTLQALCVDSGLPECMHFLQRSWIWHGETMRTIRTYVTAKIALIFNCTCAHIMSCFKSRYQITYACSKCMFEDNITAFWTFNPRLASTSFKQKYGSSIFF